MSFLNAAKSGAGFPRRVAAHFQRCSNHAAACARRSTRLTRAMARG